MIGKVLELEKGVTAEVFKEKEAEEVSNSPSETLKGNRNFPSGI